MKKTVKKRTRREGLGEILNSRSPFIYSEAYKALRTNVEFLSSSNNAKKILITSTLAGEGKSCVSINLAISLAQTGKKVIILDCDLRKPKLHRYLRIKHASQYGVSTVLGGTAELDSSIGYLEDLNLYVMLAGPTPPNPTELLSNERCKAMFDRLAARFDYIICDTAPATMVTDAVQLSQNCDGVVFVIRQNYATFDQVRSAISRLETVNAKLLGTVLNMYKSEEDSKNYYGYYSSYYSSKSFDNED